MATDPNTGQSSTGVTVVTAIMAALGGGFVGAIIVALLFALFGAFSSSE